MPCTPSFYEKQPYEKRELEIKIVKNDGTDETVTSLDDYKVFDSADPPVDKTSEMVDGTPAVSTPYVTIVIKAGTDGENYNLRLRLTTDGGDKIEEDLDVKVREKTFYHKIP